jgi:hypothetical protein
MAADGGNAVSRLDYWPLRKGDDVVSAYKKKRQRYFNAIENKGLRRIYEIGYCQYYGLNPNAIGDMATQTLAFVGENNEFLRFRINEFRSFVKQQIAMARGERPAFKGMGINTDYTTLAQIQSSDQVIAYLYQTGTGEMLEHEALEANAVVGMGCAHLQWDFDGGDEVDVELPDPDGGMVPQQHPQGFYEMVPATVTTPMKSGLPTATLHFPWESPCDPDVRGGKHAWRSIRERRCKFELAEEYEEHADDLIAMQMESDTFSSHALFGFDLGGANEDDIMVDHVYIARCKLLPRGRYMGIAGDILLWDEELPIDEIPIVDLCSARYMGASLGYCDNWDLIAPQEMRDQLCSDAASNFTKFGRPMIVADEGLLLDQRLVSRGHYIWTKPPGTEFPKATQFEPMPPGFMEFLGYLHQRDQSLTGQNSVTRGQPDKNVTSGEMAALFHSLAFEFRSAEQAALYAFRKGVANMFLTFVRRYAQAPFLAEVTGHSERPFLKEVEKDTLSGIKRVILEPVSSLSRSTAGRLTVANVLMKVPDPKQRAALQKGIETGQWGDFCKKDRNSDLRVTWENEQLAQGIPCRVLASDNPFEHLPGHLADIDARSDEINGNPAAAQAYLEHCMEHLQQYQLLNPNLARVLNIPLPLPIQGTPAGQANLMLTGPVEPVPQPGEGAPDAAMGAAAKASAPMQGRDASGVKLPNPSSPPKGSDAQGQASGATA